MDSLLELFCHTSTIFAKPSCLTGTSSYFQPVAHADDASGLCMSEIMTILIHFHQSNYRNFKAYYLEYVMTQPTQ
jgi:hypothetical protein